ncbi:MAG: MFS transporter [Cyanobacteria bacterium P01_G01_bin.67]
MFGTNIISRRNLKNFGLLGSLCVSQSMPFWFLYQALPVLLRQQGTSLTIIGLLHLATTPFIFKFLWSPAIDRYSFARWGHYRFWIVFFQLWVVSITIVCSLLDLKSQLPWLLLGLLLLGTGSASQDIATDALALRLLEPPERGIGNAIQGVGGSLGKMIGGGGMLILLNRWGWTPSLLTLAVIMMFALLPVLVYREPHRKIVSSASKSNSIGLLEYFKIFLRFCQQPGMTIWLIILALCGAAHRLSATVFQLLLVDIGLSLSDVGSLLGIFGQSMMMLGTIISGLLIPVWGRKRSLVIASSFSLTGILSYFLPTFGYTYLPVIYAIVSITFFSIGMVMTTSFTIIMDKSRLEMAGTDYTLQSSLIGIGGIVSATLSGFLADTIGYRGVFATSVLLLVVYLRLVVKKFAPVKFERLDINQK